MNTTDLRRHLVTQMNRGQIEPAERGNDQNDQCNHRGVRNTGGDRGVNHEQQADGPKTGVQQRQCPGREPPLQDVGGEHQAAKRGNRKDDDSIGKHCNSPCWTESP